MFFKRNLRNIFILFIVTLLIPLTNCKKQSTTPDINDLTRPVIWLNFFNMSFAAYEKGPNPSSQILQIKNSGQQSLDYTLSADADWVSFSPESGTSTGQITEHTISVNKTGLNAQSEDYAATITITSSQAYNNPQAATVSLTLSEEPPAEIWVNTQQLTFDGEEGGSNPDSQTITIKNTGTATLKYEITKNANWLNVNPASGTVQTGENVHTVSVNTGGLQDGTYSGTITITDPNATNSPQQVNVTLIFSEKPPPPPPPLPPSTENKVGISIKPKQGETGTTVTLTISVNGNTSPIANAFGLDLHYVTSIFEYLSTSKGNLTSSWAAVDGGTSSGTITVGGFRGSGKVISTGSQGSIAIVRLQVIPSSGQTTQITMDSLIDDIAGMIINPGSVTFTRN